MSTVLVVEDEANVRKLVSVNLTSRGHTVLEAKDAQQALGHLHLTSPDLLILDIKLPDLTGWEILTRMTNDPTIKPNFPVLLMTASIMDAQVERNQYPQVVDILIKPFSAGKLVLAVERALHPVIG